MCTCEGGVLVHADARPRFVRVTHKSNSIAVTRNNVLNYRENAGTEMYKQLQPNQVVPRE